MILKRVTRFFDKLEDRIRGWFSRRPILYAFVGGVGVVLFWRGVWHTADMVMDLLFPVHLSATTDYIGGWPWWDGPLSLFIGSIMLLLTGVFVSDFIGDQIIISGLKGEKKIIEKTEEEVQQEIGTVISLKKDLDELKKRMDKIEKK